MEMFKEWKSIDFLNKFQFNRKRKEKKTNKEVEKGHRNARSR